MSVISQPLTSLVFLGDKAGHEWPRWGITFPVNNRMVSALILPTCLSGSQRLSLETAEQGTITQNSEHNTGQ